MTRNSYCTENWWGRQQIIVLALT
uniref:Uncharacterized protein n=1 Tax=Anguilla anguilla TaxID=7936 RepID=A0A0E9RLC4_ANGAN